MKKALSRLTLGVVAAAVALGISHADDKAGKTKDKQQPDAGGQAARFSSRTELVLVPAIVTDRSGAHVPNLSKDDFIVLENGAEQKISTFEEIKATAAPLLRAAGPAGEFTNVGVAAAQPRRVNVIVLDMINTPFADQAYARQQLIKYLSQSVNRGDLTTLATFTQGGLHVVHDFTTDPAVLIAALKKVRGQADLMSGENVDSIAADTLADPAATLNEANDISAFLTHMEAVSAQFRQQMATQATLDAFNGIANAYAGIPGRKALIWMTASFPFDLPKVGDIHAGQFMTAFQRAFENLNNANIAVYPVDARGLVYGGPSAADNIRFNARNPAGVMPARMSRLRDTFDTMNIFADMTGGRAFYNTNDLSAAASKAAQDSAAYYVLGYYLKNDPEKLGWRKLEVKVRRGGTHVRARTGFYVVRQRPDSDSARRSDIAAALRSPFDFTALPVTVRWSGRGGAAGDTKNVDFEVTLKANSFLVDDGDNNHVSLEFLAVVRDPTLRQAGQVGQTVEAHLRPDSLQKVLTSGLTYHNRLNVGPGDYTVRFVVRDNLSGKMGSVLAPLKVQ